MAQLQYTSPHHIFAPTSIGPNAEELFHTALWYFPHSESQRLQPEHSLAIYNLSQYTLPLPKKSQILKALKPSTSPSLPLDTALQTGSNFLISSNAGMVPS